ncbi:aldehyde dehydrogenase [Caldalkalibacillus thermarum]|uniref:aldehyde dehydrogenase family protein n=1 Tax=Caldalkalibacillus thermarum TaxID=296745 RepID=UPI00166E048D|nr:aldehyde dehydrogenase family protein [Caldalkalibacillus thermarum]GGK30364.1 aldehyde dehydrogenase [Caldalkalibacillus thermarum]
MNMTEKDIEIIVQSVLHNVESALGKSASASPSVSAGSVASGEGIKPVQFKQVPVSQQETVKSPNRNRNLGGAEEKWGVFNHMEDAIEASYRAQMEFVKHFQLKDREKIITAIREAVVREKEVLARKVYEETKIGRYEDKVAKHELAALKTPGTEDLKTEAFSGDNGLTIVERAPYGLIGAVTPVTNPTETIINNAIGMLAAGNAVVFNVHPSSKRSCAYAVQLINKAITEAGGPHHLVTMVKEPTLDTLQTLIDSPKVKLLVGTGGPGLVQTLLKSGKKAIGAGAGNPPVIVDDTADLEHAARSIIEGAAFDNNLLCIAEKEVFVLESVADDLIFHMLNHGAYMLGQHEVEQVMAFALEEQGNEQNRGCGFNPQRHYQVSKDWIGQDARLFLEHIGVQPPTEVKLLICDVEFDHPFVQLEQMMPVLPIVRVKTLDEAIEKAVMAEHGNRHTAIMHSKNVDHLTKFARAIQTTLFVKNASSLAGVGYGGEGHTTMTIAGPTGEGVTSAKTFTRERRCVLAEGGFRIIG